MSQNDLRETYKTLFSSSDGRIILEDLQKRYFILGSTFHNDSHETAYCEGQRTVILFLQSMLRDIAKREEVAET